MFCFTNILIIFFSFVTCSIETHTKTQELALKRLYLFKIFLRSMAQDSSRGSRALGGSRANSCPPPSKFLSPYAYGPVSRERIKLIALRVDDLIPASDNKNLVSLCKIFVFVDCESSQLLKK